MTPLPTAEPKATFPERRSLVWWLSLLAATLLLGLLLVLGRTFWERPRPPAADSAAEHWQQAQEALATDDFLLAQKHLAFCLEAWPIHAEAHFLMARICRRAEDAAGWQTYWKRAALLGWDRPALELERQLLQAQSGNLHSVEESLQRHLESRSSDEALIFESLAKGYLRTDRLADLLALTRQWSARAPQDWQPLLYRARALHVGRSLQPAIAEYERVLKQKPDHAEAHLELAGAFQVNSQFQEAAEHFQTYLQFYPDDLVALVRLADCQLSLGQPDGARASLDRFLALHKEDAAGFFVCGKLALAEHKVEEALTWLRRAERLAPHETDITYNLLLVLQQLGKQAEAKQYEGKLQGLRRQFEELENLKRKIQAQPAEAALREQAGALCLRLGHAEEALHWLRTALQLEPDRGSTRELLAECRRKLGNPSVATAPPGQLIR